MKEKEREESKGKMKNPREKNKTQKRNNISGTCGNNRSLANTCSSKH